jgi:uncharacterized ferritin-like protein (DUF455 family)
VAVSVFVAAGQALSCADPDQKTLLTRTLQADWNAGRLQPVGLTSPQPIDQPGRPAHLELVHPRRLPRRSLHTRAGRIVLIHAITHIEFNAINLALDAVYRFRDQPRDYYGDWLQVATEEAYHFNLLRERLKSFGHDYGDFPGHDGLWDMARRTAHDPLVRMALVPRVLEARGLDVTPGIMAKLHQAGDAETAAILQIILNDEIAHVGIGSRWFRYLCAQRALDPETTFHALLTQYFNGDLRGPFNTEARLRAGFSRSELALLAAADGEKNG